MNAKVLVVVLSCCMIPHVSGAEEKHATASVHPFEGTWRIRAIDGIEIPVEERSTIRLRCIEDRIAATIDFTAHPAQIENLRKDPEFEAKKKSLELFSRVFLLGADLSHLGEIHRPNMQLSGIYDLQQHKVIFVSSVSNSPLEQSETIQFRAEFLPDFDQIKLYPKLMTHRSVGRDQLVERKIDVNSRVFFFPLFKSILESPDVGKKMSQLIDQKQGTSLTFERARSQEKARKEFEQLPADAPIKQLQGRWQLQGATISEGLSGTLWIRGYDMLFLIESERTADGKRIVRSDVRESRIEKDSMFEERIINLENPCFDPTSATSEFCQLGNSLFVFSDKTWRALRFDRVPSESPTNHQELPRNEWLETKFDLRLQSIERELDRDDIDSARDDFASELRGIIKIAPQQSQVSRAQELLYDKLLLTKSEVLQIDRYIREAERSIQRGQVASAKKRLDAVIRMAPNSSYAAESRKILDGLKP